MHAHEHKKMTFCICISLAQPTESVRESGCICICVGTHTDRDIHRSINKRCFHFSGIFVFGCLFCNCHAHVEALAAPKNHPTTLDGLAFCLGPAFGCSCNFATVLPAFVALLRLCGWGFFLCFFCIFFLYF